MPFYVLATQNPIEHEGTYPLPEAQLDRFLMKLVVGYPDRDAELAMLDLPGLSDAGPTRSKTDAPLLGPPSPRSASCASAARCMWSNPIKGYLVDLVRATRDPAAYDLADLAPLIELGASPRATLALLRALTGPRAVTRPRLCHAARRQIHRLRCAPPPRDPQL